MIRVEKEAAALTTEHRLRRAVGRRPMPALMTGLAGVPGVDGLKATTLVAQALGQLAPVAGQYAAVQPRLGLDVSAGLRLCAPGRLGHALGIELLRHQGMGLVRQGPADVVGVMGPDPFLLAPQLRQLPAQPPRPHRALALAGLQPLLTRYFGLQAGQVGQGVPGAVAVGDLAHIAVQTQNPGGRTGPHRVSGHRVGEVDVPLGPRPCPFLADAGLERLPVGIQVAALEPQPAAARHVQLVVPDLDAFGEGEAILVVMLAFEHRIAALALKEGLVRVRQVLQDIPHSRETVLPQPRVLRVPPESRELLAQAEEGELGLSRFRTDLVVLPAPIGPVL